MPLEQQHCCCCDVTAAAILEVSSDLAHPARLSHSLSSDRNDFTPWNIRALISTCVSFLLSLFFASYLLALVVLLSQQAPSAAPSVTGMLLTERWLVSLITLPLSESTSELI